MSTSTDRLISCIDQCKRYKFENAIKNCNNYCTHQHLVRLFTKSNNNADYVSPTSTPPLVSPTLTPTPTPSRSV